MDIPIFENNSGIAGWEGEKRQKFIFANTSVPAGATNQFMDPYALICVSRDYRKQGEYPLRIALEILGGRHAQDVPVVRARKAKILLNMKLAKELGIKFPLALIERAVFVSEEHP